MRFKDVYSLLKSASFSWYDDNASRLAAALAFYTGISLAPMLVIVLAILGAFYGDEAAQGRLVDEIAKVTDRQAAQFIEMLISNADQPTTASFAGLFSLAVLFWGSTRVFVQLQEALNAIWNVEPAPDHAFKHFVRKRIFSFGMVLAIAFLLIVSLIISAVLSFISNSFSDILPGTEWLWMSLNLLISFAVITAMFAAIFKVLPDAKVAWGDVWLGAIATTLLFIIGKFALGMFLGSRTSTYGAASSLMAVLLWVYYSSQIVFFGAEITQAYAKKHGSGIKPADNARFTSDAPEKQSPG